MKLNLRKLGANIKYNWGEKETDPKVLHLNFLHKVDCCSTCMEFEDTTSKCTRRNIIVKSDSQRCEPTDFQTQTKMHQCIECKAAFFTTAGLFEHPCVGKMRR